MDEMHEQDDIGLLIRNAGARETVATERLEKARANVADHWAEIVATRRVKKRQSYSRYLAVAASVVVAVSIGFLLWQPAAPPASTALASVNRVIGSVSADGVALRAGDTIRADSIIETGVDGRVALDLATGHSLRVDVDTRLTAQQENRYSLEFGGVYIDSGSRRRSDSVFIATHLGVASDVGTQFQVRVTADAVLVGVREGLVELARDDVPLASVEFGQFLEVSKSGQTERRDADPDDDAWTWVHAILPGFDIEGASLQNYLEWYTRERGIMLEWHDRQSRDNGARIHLSGSIRGLSLDDGLHAVLKIAPFEYVIENGVMTVQVQ